ncbi:hypothetical protein [Nostoc sp.]|uniref:hypothetical protein n=1 Tax=Nostoc sp. TaxID=1180 RepID=UPI002FF72659
MPDAFVEEVNTISLDELNERGLIIWVEDLDSGAVILAEDLEPINNELLNFTTVFASTGNYPVVFNDNSSHF